MKTKVIKRLENNVKKASEWIKESHLSVDQDWLLHRLVVPGLMKNSFMAKLTDNFLTLIFRVRVGSQMSKKFATITHYLELPCELDPSSITTSQEHDEVSIFAKRRHKGQHKEQEEVLLQQAS